jgi:hypothetical protein
VSHVFAVSTGRSVALVVVDHSGDVILVDTALGLC